MDILNNNQILDEAKFEEHIGKEMVHLAKFREIPQYAGTSWVTSVCQGSKDFINNWNKSSKKREKFSNDIEKSLDDAYIKELEKEGLVTMYQNYQNSGLKNIRLRCLQIKNN